MRLLINRLPQLASLARPAAVLGVLLFAMWLAMRPARLLLNDAYVTAGQHGPVEVIHGSVDGKDFQATINFEQMTIGLITGMVLGVIVGKLSLALVLVTLLAYFLVSYLEKKGIISVPWNQIISLGREKINVKHLIFEKPSFKVPFSLAFLIAAYNVR